MSNNDLPCPVCHAQHHPTDCPMDADQDTRVKVKKVSEMKDCENRVCGDRGCFECEVVQREMQHLPTMATGKLRLPERRRIE